MTYTINFENGDPQVAQEVRDRLREFNQQFVAPYTYNPLTLTVRNSEGELLGGCLGGVGMNWLNIDILWVREDMRGKGLGREVLRAMEAEGRRLGATSVVLDTFEFQAKGFYEKEGYAEYGRIEQFAPGFDRYYMQKRPL